MKLTSVFQIAPFLIPLATADYVKLEASKLRGSWIQDAEVDNEPFYGYFKAFANETNQTVVGALFNEKVYYAIDLALGSNAQNVTVLIDTGSSDLWVNSVDNEVCALGLDQTNFTLEYEYPSSISAKASASASAPASSISASTTSEETGWGIFYTDTTVTSDATTTSTLTTVYKSVVSRDIQFYPSASSTNYASAYPTPTYNVSSLIIEYFEPQNCSSWGLFDKDSSDSFISNGTEFSIVSDDDDEISGEWGADSVKLGGVTVSNLSFAVVDESEFDSFGVLGLDLPIDESTYSENGTLYENLPLKLKSEGLIEKVVYALGVSSFNTSINSSLIFGGVDLEQANGNFTLVPLIRYADNSTNSTSIAITLSSISFDDNYLDVNDTSLIASGLAAAVLDTSDATAKFPYYIFDEIVLAAGFNYSESLGNYVANYTELVNKTIILDFQGVDIEIPLADLTFPLVDFETGDVSDFAVIGLEAWDEDSFVLGDSILSSLYFAIDLEDDEVAIAPRNFNAVGENIEEVVSTIPSATTATSYNYTVGYHSVTDLKLATVNNPNSVTTVSFSQTVVPSASAYF